MNNPQPTSDGSVKRSFKTNAIVGALCVALVGALLLWQSQKKNQFVPPIPGPTPPVVGELPALITAIERRSGSAEGVAAHAKRRASEGRLTPTQLQKGRTLYDQCREESNGVARYIAHAMDRLFVPADLEEIRLRSERADLALAALMQWQAEFDRPVITSLPGQEILDLLKDYLKATEAANEAQKQMWKAKLEAAQARPWADIPAERE